MSIGAWHDENGPRYYRWQAPPYLGRDDVIDRYAVLAIQTALVESDIADESLETGLFNWATKRAVQEFQEDWMGIKRRRSDGVVGPQVAKMLFADLVNATQRDLGIPDDLLCALLELESAWDPGATGYVDPRDRGLAQINSTAHPEVSDDQAFTPSFAIPWTGRRLRTAFETFNRDFDWDRQLTWDLAIASHNSPVRAGQWAVSGEAPDEEIAQYVALVRSRC